MGLIFEFKQKDCYIGNVTYRKRTRFWYFEVRLKNEDPRNKKIIDDFIKNQKKDSVWLITKIEGSFANYILYSLSRGKPGITEQIKGLVRKFKEINRRVDYLYINLSTDTYLKHGDSIYYDRVRLNDEIMTLLYEYEEAGEGTINQIKDEELR